MINFNSANIVDIVDDLEEKSGRISCQFSNTTDPLKYFGFNCNPFQDSVNPEFFFRTESHEDAYIKMKDSIENDISLGLTTAVAGTGKTLLTQILLSELPQEKYKSILILAYPQMSRTALLKEIVKEIGAGETTEKGNVHDYLEIIQDEIISLYKKHIKLIVIIDEVHFLDAKTLHILRTLSNIEIPEKKLITVLLFGEDIFLKRMANPSYKSIFSRMFVRAQLRPLLVNEVEQYIKFRCLVAGGNAAIFSQDCYETIYKYSKGIPRDINRIAYNAMVFAAESGIKTISAQFLKEIINKK